MLKRIPTLLLCLLFAIALPACDSDGDGDGNGGGGGGGGGGGMMVDSGFEATIDGESFVATLLAIAERDSDGSISITGSNLATTIGLDLEQSDPGTYQFNEDNTATVVRATNTGVTEAYSTAAGGSGSATITSISATEVEGTFSFTANSLNSTGSIMVSGGFAVNIVD